MHIEPSQYLQLTTRLQILTQTLQTQSTKLTTLHNKTVAQAQKIRLLESHIQQLQKQKQDQKSQIKEHITSKADHVVAHVNGLMMAERQVVGEEIGKLRNWSAVEVLGKLEERIVENRTVTFEKEFYEKVKTLYIIKKKKGGCSSTELFQWVRQIAQLKKPNQQQNSLSGTQKSMKKSQKPSSKQSTKQLKLPLSQSKALPLDQIPDNPIIKQQADKSRQPLKITLKIQEPLQDPLSDI